MNIIMLIMYSLQFLVAKFRVKSANVPTVMAQSRCNAFDA